MSRPHTSSAALLRRLALSAAVKPLLEGLETRQHFSVAPVAVPGGPYNVNEGQSVQVSGLGSTDSDGHVVSYQWDTNYNALKGFKNRLTAPTWTFQADNSGTRNIALRVVDNNGDVSSVQTTSINVADLAPTITLTAPSTSQEASRVDISWGYTDPSAADVVTGWTVDWGDDTTSTYDGSANASHHVYDEDGTYAITLTATQANENNLATSVSQNIVVSNVTPIVDASAPRDTMDEGETAIAYFSSPNRGDTLDGWTIDWGDGTVDLLANTRNTAHHVYADNGNYAAVITAQEPDGGSGSATLNYTVRNVASDVTQTGVPATGTEGSAITVGSTVHDAGVNDTWTYGWSVYRNGTQFSLPGGVDTTGSSLTFTPTDNGNYVVRLTVTDKDGAETTVNSDRIVVANVNPTATISGAPGSSVNEGDTVSLTANPADAGSEDTFGYDWSVTKDGQAFALPANADTNSSTFNFVPTDDGSYVATVIVSDDDGGTVSVSSAAITAVNVNPTATIDNAPTTGEEGTAIEVAATPADAGAADTFGYAWSVTKDGQAYAVSGHTDRQTFAFTPSDNGDYVIGLVVTDDDGGTVSVSSSTIAVANVAPTATITGDDETTEGSPASYTAAVVDPGTSDTAAYLWTVTKDGSAYNLGGATDNAGSFTFTPDDDGAYVVSVQVSDGDGGSSTQTYHLNVLNAKPVATINNAPATGDEGSAITLGSTVTDAGVHDTWTYAWSLTQDGTAVDVSALTTNASSFTFTPADNGSYVATLVVTDNGGATRTVSTAAMVIANVAPTGTIAGEPGTPVDEGSGVNLTATPADAGTLDTFSYAWTIKKDGQAWTAPAGTVLDAATLAFVPTDNGDYVASVKITDKDGGTVSVDSQTITAVNVDPTASIAGAPVSDPAEGSTTALTADATDAGAADTFTYAWSVTKDGVAVDLTGTDTAGETFDFKPTDNGAYVITLVVGDDDGGTTTTSASIHVVNADPAPTISGSNTTNEDQAITLNVAANDPGSSDTHTYAWSVTRDGQAYVTGLGAADGTSFTFTPNLYGVYTVSCTVTDNDGGTATATKTVTALNVAPAGVAISGTPTGPRPEGAPISFHGVAGDASGETHLSYAWSVTRGTGQAFALPAGTVVDGHDFEFTPTHSGKYKVMLTVTDSGGKSTSTTTSTIVVTNALPFATLSGTPTGPIAEGTGVALHVDAADPGTEDVLSYAWTVTKDGHAYTLPNGVATNTADLTFVPNDNGSYLATCVVTDDDGGPISVNSGAITVTNVAPTVSIMRNSQAGHDYEGTDTQYRSTVTDPGSADTFTYQWTATKDGVAYNLNAPATGAILDFIPTDQGVYVLTVTVTDKDGGTGSMSFTTPVGNVAPTINVDGVPATGKEGQAMTFGAAASDPGVNDVLGYVWTVQKPSGQTDTLTGVVANYTPADNGTYKVRLTVSDADGGVATGAWHTVNVANVNPQVSPITAPSDATEGTSISGSVTATDVAADPLSYAWTVTRNGQAYTPALSTGANTAAFSFVASDNGYYVLRATVTDKDGGGTVVDKPVLVANVAPTATISGGQGTVNEGDAASFGVAATDASTADALAGFGYAWSVTKDGKPFALPEGTVTNQSNFSFTPTDEGAYVASVKVTDKDGGFVTKSQSLTAIDVAPTAAIAQPESGEVDEGSTVSLTGTGTDAGVADVLTYRWSVTKDGELFADSGEDATGPSYSFVPTDNGTYVVSLTTSDGLLDSDAASTTIVVSNVAPTATISGPDAANEGQPVMASVTPADAGSDDTFAYAWSLTKDGQAVDLEGSVTDAADFAFAPADQGVYVLSCVVTDDDGAQASVDHTVTVSNVDPTVSPIDVATTGTEGTAITAGSSASDVPGDSLSYGWTVYKNGKAFTLPEGTETTGTGLTFTPTDEGSYVVRLTVQDEDGGSTTVNSDPIQVAGVAPAAAVTGDTQGIEGKKVSLGSSASDAGGLDQAAGFTYAWTVTRGNTVVASGKDANLSFTPSVHGVYKVSLTVTDKDGLSTTAASMVTVANVAPTAVTLSGNKTGVLEGQAVSLTAGATDASGDTVTYGWQVLKGQTVFASGKGANVNFTPARGGYTIVVTATDSGNLSTTQSFDLGVGNVAPTAALNAPTATLQPGQAASFGLAYGDVPVDQALSVTWDYGDGSTAKGSYVGNGSVTTTHAFAARGTYTVKATVSDGTDTTVVTKLVTVSEAALVADPLDATKTALVVNGSAGDDTISVVQQPTGAYAVSMNGVSLGKTFTPSGRVYVYGNGGANAITVTGSNDAVVFAGTGASYVATGSGNDIIVGSKADDRLFGNDGRDLIIGGAGADQIRGGSGDDLILTGSTSTMNSLTALANAEAIWTGRGTTAQRRSSLLNVFSAGGMTADNGNTVYGEDGNDWLVVNASSDKIKDLQAGDIVK